MAGWMFVAAMLQVLGFPEWFLLRCGFLSIELPCFLNPVRLKVRGKSHVPFTEAKSQRDVHFIKWLQDFACAAECVKFILVNLLLVQMLSAAGRCIKPNVRSSQSSS